MVKKKMAKKEKSSSPEKSLCAFCKKKLLTLPFQCKFCSLEFCDAHRLPEDHSCLGLAARKEQLRARLQRGEKVTYEPRAGEEHYGLDLKAMTDPLLKSPLAIIGMIVAAVAIVAILFLIFR